MDPDSTLTYIEDILVAIANIEEDTAGLDQEAFIGDRRVRQLVERNIEIVSEASRRLPSNLQDAEKSVPWPSVSGIGNVLRHEYRDVAADVLWNTVTKSIPTLKRAMLRMREELTRRTSNFVQPRNGVCGRLE